MNFLRKHWYDLGGIFAIFILTYILICYKSLTNFQTLMWLNLVSLFLHQLEEYRIVGTFPGMLNKAMYKSDIPDRYPLNTNTAFYINVIIGWTFYFLSAVFAEKAIWLGMATIVVSVSNIIAHTIVFNIKGKTIYNAGLATSWLLFAPCAWVFFTYIHSAHIATKTDYFIGIPLGILLNLFGILKLIDWMKDKNTSYIFEQRNFLPKNRKTSRK